MNTKKVTGKNKRHRVMLFALSTCGWCRKTKELLSSSDVEYEYIDVDRCTGDERKEVSDKVRELNPRGSYPTIQIDDNVVTGFDEERIRELLEL